jgi:hypothetical protein
MGIIGWYSVTSYGKYVCVICGGKDEKRVPSMEFYCTREMRVVLRVVRKEMGVLF